MVGKADGSGGRAGPPRSDSHATRTHAQKWNPSIKDFTPLTINNTLIEDTFAEAFPMTAARLIVTAETAEWRTPAGQVVTGYVVGDWLRRRGRSRAGGNGDETIDGRPASGCAAIRLQPRRVKSRRQSRRPVHPHVPHDGVLQRIADRQGKTIKIGGNLRFFGDGNQFSKKLESRRFWRIGGGRRIHVRGCVWHR